MHPFLNPGVGEERVRLGRRHEDMQGLPAPEGHGHPVQRLRGSPDRDRSRCGARQIARQVGAGGLAQVELGELPFRTGRGADVLEALQQRPEFQGVE